MSRDPVATVLATPCAKHDAPPGYGCAWAKGPLVDENMAFCASRIRAAASLTEGTGLDAAPPAQPETPSATTGQECAEWCSTPSKYIRPPSDAWTLIRLDGGYYFCTEACRDAGKPLHPKRCGTCNGAREIAKTKPCPDCCAKCGGKPATYGCMQCGRQVCRPCARGKCDHGGSGKRGTP